MVCLFNDGISLPLWELYRDMYTDVRSAVKVNGTLSREFKELVGIRQGAGTSSGCFRRRGTDGLMQLSSLEESYKIGTIQVGAPTCADDTIMLSTTIMGAQLQLSLAEHNANCHRFQFSDKKTKVMVMNSKSFDLLEPFELNGKMIEFSNEEKHLGIHRTIDGKNKITVTERVKAGRRACYKYMSAGMHGFNGTGLKVSMHLWKICVLPSMIHSLEALILEKSDFKILEVYQKTFLRQVQHLPTSTATPALYLLSGDIPFEGHVHMRMLTFFVRMINRNMIEKDIILRQLSLKGLKDYSWVMEVRKLLWKYELPSVFDIVVSPPGKESWKYEVKKAVQKYWLEELKKESEKFKSLKFLNLEACKVGKVHPVWDIIDPSMVEQANVQAKLLVQRYPLHGLPCSGRNRSDTCPLCKEDIETLQHFLLDCPKLESTRKPYVNKIIDMVLGHMIITKESMVQVVLDPSVLVLEPFLQKRLATIARKLCFILHHERILQLGGGSSFLMIRNRLQKSIMC